MVYHSLWKSRESKLHRKIIGQDKAIRYFVDIALLIADELFYMCIYTYYYYYYSSGHVWM